LAVGAAGFVGFEITWRGDVYDAAAQSSSAAKYGTLGINLRARKATSGAELVVAMAALQCDVSTPPTGRFRKETRRQASSRHVTQGEASPDALRLTDPGRVGAPALSRIMSRARRPMHMDVAFPASSCVSPCAGVPARDAALDVAQTAALQSLNGKRLVLDMIERIPQLVICFESHQQRIK
jgi:hypothetical protein